MRSPKAGLADLKRLSEAAARASEKAQAGAHPQTKTLQAQAGTNPRINPLQTQAGTNPQINPLQTQAGTDPTFKLLQTESGAKTPRQAQTVPAVALTQDKLFAQAVRSVQPLSKAQTRLLLRPNTDPTQRAQLTERRQRAVGDTPMRLENLSDGAGLPKDTEVELSWAAAGIGPSVLRQLARAFWPIGAHLDLQCLSSGQARAALGTFIENSQNHATRCVCIIHGVGYGSANGQPVLPVRVRQWLKQLPAVSAFAQAPKTHGGAGALLALIRLT